MAKYTFDRELRLLNSGQYDKVFKKPVRASAPKILVLATRNNKDTPRLGLVVPKKAVKRAVWRNRIKRVARETFRHTQHKLPHIDIVVLVKLGVNDLSNSEISSTLIKLWDQISLRLNNQQS